MSFPRYERYKDSGVEWLGEVPEHWRVDRMKNTVASCRNGIWGQEPAGDERDIPCVRVADFDRQRLTTGENVPTLRNVTASERSGRVLRRGDLLLEKSGGGDIQPVGCVVLYSSDREAICSNFIARMAIAAEFDPSFCRYLHFAMYALRLTTRSINQTSGIQNLDQSAYLSEAISFPTREEQQAIAVFLDQETAKIDALIEEQRRLIELLKEKRQAVISHAVTKGLDPKAPMTDSGSEWLGDIPAHWAAGTLTRISERVVVGIAEAATHAYADDGVPILRSTNIRPNQITGAVLMIDPAFAAARGSKVLREHDLVTVRTGNAGVTAVIPPALDGCQCFTMLITTLARPHDPSFYSFYLNSTVAQSYFSVEGWGTAQTNISVPILKSLPIPIPPAAQQQSIAEYVGGVSREVDELIALADAMVALLAERRSALISAAVTGKIDVRNYQPQETAAHEEVYEPA